jgi:hypothetical protein
MIPIISTRIKSHFKNIFVFRIISDQNEGLTDEDESLMMNYFWKFTE